MHRQTSWESHGSENVKEDDSGVEESNRVFHFPLHRMAGSDPFRKSVQEEFLKKEKKLLLMLVFCAFGMTQLPMFCIGLPNSDTFANLSYYYSKQCSEIRPPPPHPPLLEYLFLFFSWSLLETCLFRTRIKNAVCRRKSSIFRRRVLNSSTLTQPGDITA